MSKLRIFSHSFGIKFRHSAKNSKFAFRILPIIIVSDRLTPEQRHNVMAAIRSASTKPELKLRRTLWRLGFRYRVNEKRLPGTPDIVLPRYRTVIFVHGCFWHGHKGCKFYTVPKTNTDFWTSKIARNQGRDQEVWRQLEAKGWAVIIVWECQLKNACFSETVQQVKAEIISNGERFTKEREERKASRQAYLKERKAKREREATLLVSLKNR